MKKLISIILLLYISSFPEALIAVPLNGQYTIDATQPTAGSNFQSFTAFAGSINVNGVSGNVVVTVVAGTGPYQEQVIFNNIPGAGPNATITIEGNGELITATTTTLNRHVIRLTNCQYFTINNMNVSRDPASSGGFYGIHIFSTGNHITISNCSADMPGTTSTLDGAYIASGSEGSILITGDFHNLTFDGNTSNGGGYGVSVFGLITNLASGIVISNNTFLNYHSNGIYLRETNGAQIFNNFFDKASNNVTSCNAIQLAQNANINGQVFNNVLTVSQTANGSMTQRGIYLFNGTGHKVYNNVIRNIQLTSGNYTAIEIRTGGTAPEIFFNTISLDNTLTGNGKLYGIKEELSNTNAILRNNIISITQPTTDTKTGLVLASNSSLSTAFNSDYNDIYIPGGNTAQKGSPFTTITYYPTLANWQSVSGQDAHSTSTDPVFAAPNYPQPTNGLMDNTGIQIPWIVEDITGATRANPPDMGAYEFSAAPPATPDTIYGPLEVCEFSENVNYFITPVTGATSYTWTVTGASLVSGQGTTSIHVDFTDIPANLSVIASNNTGSSNPAGISVIMNPLPLVSLTLPYDTLCILDPPIVLSGGIPLNGTYTGTGVVNNEFNPAFAGMGSHTITYTYETPEGCSAAATDLIYVDVCPGIPENVFNSSAVKVYPNPCSSYCIIDLNGTTQKSIVSLFNLSGMKIREFHVESPLSILSTIGIPAGIYLLEAISEPSFRQYVKLDIH
ncbi:MAG: T9SS type A sorting domain-containing protein [Bacteroidales bacterium]